MNQSRVAEKTLINDRFCLLHLEHVEPNRIQFRAGQYIQVSVGKEKRKYSIASEPAMEHGFKLLVDVGVGGKGSKYLTNLSLGDEVNFDDPEGRFAVVEEIDEKGELEEKELVFVAIGSGIAPIRSMILDLLGIRGEKRKIWLHWGLEEVKDMFWEEDFYQLTDDFDNFEVDIVLARPPMPDWKLCSGSVTDCLDDHHEGYGEKGFYICGGGDGVESVVDFLDEKRVGKDKIHVERYY